MSRIEESVERGDPLETTQQLIDEQATRNREALVAKARQLVELKEQFGLWSDLVDMTDSFTFDKEDGVRAGPRSFFYGMSQAYGMALVRPGFSSCAYINLQQLRLIRAYSRAFSLLNPYWWAIQHNRASYVVENGHTYTVGPRNPKEKVEDGALQDVQDVIDELCLSNDWTNYQREKLRRGDRDGEFFLRYYRDTKQNDDGQRILQVRFVEPLLVWDAPGNGPEKDCWFGVQFKGDYEDPQGYYVRPADYLGTSDETMNARWATMIARENIQHRKYNVDKADPRGIPTTYAIAPRLEQAMRTLVAMGKLVHYREKIALIRKHINATLSTVHAFLGTKRSTSPVDSMINVEQIPDAAILDSSDQTAYEFPSQHVDTDKIVFAVKAELQASAASLGLAEFMVSADSSTGSFAAVMVAESPSVKTFSQLQQDMIRDDQEVFREQIKMAIEDGRLPSDTLKKIKVIATPPRIIDRNRIQETQADDLLVKDGAMSRKTMMVRAGLNPNDEEKEVEKDQEADLEKQKALAAAMPQPTAGPGRTQAGSQKVTGRPLSAKDEPGPKVNPQKASEGLEESEKETPDKPTEEDLRMAAQILPDGWLEKTKQEILALVKWTQPGASECEPGIKGYPCGTVDDQNVWAVDMDAVMVKYNAPDFVVAGNSERWDFVPADKILVDWSFSPTDKAHDVLHELIEQRLCRAGWAYARAHRYANLGPGCEMDWLLVLRPELKALQAKE
jgi:capsid protein